MGACSQGCCQVWSWGRGCLLLGEVWSGGLPAARGRGTCSGCLLLGESGPGGVWSQGEFGLGGVETPTKEMATAADGTHPAGMHSCCKNRFSVFHVVVAVECKDSTPCLTGQDCQADFCQSDPCTNTGQCLHGHVCSQDSRCVCEYMH